MGKKKLEISAASANEFIFGEGGGKGRNLSSFLRSLSVNSSDSGAAATAEPTHPTETVARESWAPVAPPPPPQMGMLPLHKVSSNSLASSSKRSLRIETKSGQPQSPTFPSHRIRPGGRTVSFTQYADLDDDWDDLLESKRSVPQHPAAPGEDAAASTVSLDAIAATAQTARVAKFRKVLEPGGDEAINTVELCKLLWNGVPCEYRAVVWQVLLGYLPTNHTRQQSTLSRKRLEYQEGINMAPVDFGDSQSRDYKKSSGSTENENESNTREKQLYHQITIDVKRTHPSNKLYSYPGTQMSLRKVLYLWAVRHPASGYVQGINDLCTPFYQVFLLCYLNQLQCMACGRELPVCVPGLVDSSGADEQEQELLRDPLLATYTLSSLDPSKISVRVTGAIEADIYWCLSRLLENITDNYIHEQPGIIRQMSELRNLITKIDPELLHHFESEGIEFIQFAFRWMNCLLMREIPMDLVVRMWDTYLSENPLGFNNFHVYVCAAFLIKFSAELKQKDFQEILLFLQSPPTASWTEKDVELMLSEAFIWQSLYKNASAHLR